MTIILDGTTGISTPGEAVAGNLSYTGTLTGNGGIVNIGAGQVYKDASGNVGIGTTAPSVRLNVSKDGAAGDAGQLVRITDTNTANAVGPTSLTIGMMNHYAGNPRMSIAGTTGLSFCVGDGSDFSAQRKVDIDSSGNLLVGRTSAYSDGTLGAPAFQVSVVNGSRAGIATVATGTTNIAHIGFVNPNGLVGSIQTTGSATSYSTSSDYRLKDTIAPMTGALAKVALLKPCTYKWKVDGSDGQGFIAHELAEVEAGCVTGEKDAVDVDGNPQYQGIDTSFLVATLTAAIQEQQTLITALKARTSALEERLTALEAQIV